MELNNTFPAKWHVYEDFLLQAAEPAWPIRAGKITMMSVAANAAYRACVRVMANHMDH